MKTREQWLEAATGILAERFFKPHGLKVPKVRVSVGFVSPRGSKKALGAHWSPEASSDKVGQIFIVPSQDDSVEVLAVLIHELIHAAVGNKEGHGAKFKRAAIALGLVGKMRSTQAGSILKKRFEAEVIKKIGNIPHARLDAQVGTIAKKQTTRMLKAQCAESGYVVRLSLTWVLTLGEPICPCCNKKMAVEIPAGGDE